MALLPTLLLGLAAGTFAAAATLALTTATTFLLAETLLLATLLLTTFLLPAPSHEVLLLPTVLAVAGWLTV